MQANRILTYYTEIQQLKRGEMCSPRFADLHTSNRCNHNCVGCAYKDGLNNKIMTFDEHNKVVDDLLDLGVKGFDFAGGGDPLMIPYLSDIFDKIKKANCYYGIITNGSLLTDDLIRQIIDQATYIRISLEASCKEEYRKYKKVRAKEWYRVLDNISKLVKEKIKNKSNCEIGIKFSVGKSFRGARHYRNAMSLGNELCVDNIQFKALRHKPEELTLIEKGKENIIYNKIFKSKHYGMKLKKWILPVNDIPQCWLNPLHIVVDYLANVYICCYYYYRYDDHKIGNMFKKPLKDLWYSDYHKKLIMQIDKNECKKVDCKFFYHHKDAEQMLNGGSYEFL